MKNTNDLTIKEVKAIHTGGGIWLFVGSTEDAYFWLDDSGDVEFFDLDPLECWDDSDNLKWINRHFIKRLYGKEREAFTVRIMDMLEETYKSTGWTRNAIESYRSRFVGDRD